MPQSDAQLVQRLADYLNEQARRGQTVTYAQAARDLGLQPPQTIHRLTHALEAVMARDAAAGEPLRAALVVSRTAPRPKPGFFDQARALGRYQGPSEGPSAERFHAEELGRVLNAWRPIE